MKNKLIETFEKERCWINWEYQKTVDNKTTKVPLGSSTNPKTWHTFHALNKDKPFGIVFRPNQQLLGIDIDHCLVTTPSGELIIHHEKEDQILALLDVADTYTEISPSNTGLHVYLRITDPLPLLANKKAPFEVYTSGRFFTVTAKPFTNANVGGKDVRVVTPGEAISILSTTGYPWGKKHLKSIVVEATTPNYDVKELMFNSKNGDAIRSLWQGDTTKYNNDESSADMALCSHLAFWTRKNAQQMEQLWLESPLGSRDKTQKREDYRLRTIQAAINNTKEVYTPSPVIPNVSEEEIDLLFTWKGKEKLFTQNTENIRRILNGHSEFVGRFRYDEFTNTFEIKINNSWRPFRDSDTLDIQTRLSILFPFLQKVGKEMVYDAIIKVSIDNSIDSAADYLRSLVWDQTPRLDKWLCTVYGAKDDVLTHTIGANWLKGLVHRLIEPGCKFDYVLVLESEQGMKKSTSLNILGASWHVETTMSTDSKDFFMQFAGKAIIEFTEGETLNRTEVKKMKAIITTQSDKYRPPYERVSRDFPRRCVFAMTTNQTEYLKDETGNRRWLPIRCTKIADIEWLRANRDQLFAEAYHRVINLKETTYEFNEKELKAEQALRQLINPWEELVVDWYFKLTDVERYRGITTTMAYQKGVQGSQPFSKEVSTHDSMIVGAILRSALKLERRRARGDGERSYFYYPTQETLDMMPKTIQIADLEEQFNNL